MKIYAFAPILAIGLCIFVPPDNQFLNNTVQTQSIHSTKSISSIRANVVTYRSKDKLCNGFIAYDENRKGKLPVVIIVHEWWGLNDYAKFRAIKMAELGYFAFVADLFGNGKTASTPDEARALTKPYYSNPELTLEPVEAAITKASTFPQADITRVAAIGYCFGGFVVLNAAKLGASLKGVVSFHARLVGVQPKKGVIKGQILVCQGGADEFAPEADQAAFKKSMDSVGARYTFISYPGAMHAYTNPASTALGKKFNMPMAYNANADSTSWNDMQTFFLTILK